MPIILSLPSCFAFRNVGKEYEFGGENLPNSVSLTLFRLKLLAKSFSNSNPTAILFQLFKGLFVLCSRSIPRVSVVDIVGKSGSPSLGI